MKKIISLVLLLTCSLTHAYRDQETGTFLTRDPIGFEDGANQYCYVHCNPITHFDPLGLKNIYIGGAAESRKNSYQRLDGSLTTQVIGYGEAIGADASFSWRDTDAVVNYVKETLKENPHDNYTVVGHSWGGPASFRVAEQLQDQGISIDSLTIVTLDPVSHFSNSALGTKPPDNVSEWINVYQPATLVDAVMNIPVLGWAAGALWTGGSAASSLLGQSASKTANGIATGGGQWNAENNATKNIPAVNASGDPMGHMDVEGMMSSPLNEGSSTPTVQNHIDQRKQQGEIKKIDYQQQLVDNMATA
jgi:pimeloyl-ACP methyl ester carboxylesterase